MPPGTARAHSERRENYARLVDVWSKLHPGEPGADAIDAQLHTERLAHPTREQRRHEEEQDDLPDGAFVLHEGAPCLVLGSHLLGWTPTGYVGRMSRPVRQPARVITPPSLVSLLRLEWQPLVPLVHPSAFAAES